MPQQTSEDKTHLTSSEILPYTVAWAEGERWRVRFQSNLKRESWLSNQRVRKVPWRGVYCELMDAYASLTGAVCQCSSKGLMSAGSSMTGTLDIGSIYALGNELSRSD